MGEFRACTRTAALLAAAAVSVLTVTLAEGRAVVKQTVQQNTCYPAQFTAFLARRIMISDVVATLTATVSRPLDVCAPAAVDGARSAVSLYLTCYEIRARSIAKRELGSVSNPLGTAQLIVGSARTLCVSSSPTTKPPVRIRLTCYGVISPAINVSINKTIADRFHTSRDSVDVSRPVSFCTQTGQGSTRPLHLMCYTVASETTARALVLTDEWGVLRASPGRRGRLCIQSSLKPR